MSFNLDDLYSSRRKRWVCEVSPWKWWFAWRPVEMLYWHTDDLFTSEYPLRLYRVVWFERILRRRVEYKLSAANSYNDPRSVVGHWEYTTYEDLLIWG